MTEGADVPNPPDNNGARTWQPSDGPPSAWSRPTLVGVTEAVERRELAAVTEWSDPAADVKAALESRPHRQQLAQLAFDRPRRFLLGARGSALQTRQQCEDAAAARRRHLAE